MSNFNKHYMAGLIDGEGSIGIAANKAGMFKAPYISVASTTYELISWLKSTYGGYITTKRNYQDHHKPSWTWKLCKKNDLFNLLEELAPLLKEPKKRARAEFILKNYSSVTPRNGKYTKEMLYEKSKFEEDFFKL